jgi:hypothetical protein
LFDQTIINPTIKTMTMEIEIMGIKVVKTKVTEINIKTSRQQTAIRFKRAKPIGFALFFYLLKKL